MTIEHLVSLFAFMVPAYAANMAPPLTRFWHGWNPPLARRVLGAHKTVLGTAAGLAAAMAAAAVQTPLGAPALLAGARPWWLHGLRCAVGALGGDLAKSWLKRWRGIPPGGPWLPFDQLDFQVGALIVAGPGAGLGWLDVGLLLGAGLIGDLVVNRIAYRLGIKETKW
jgi:CDP-2,3-bis-(O-geranylgeranyl)-sn-glycerol synthase